MKLEKALNSPPFDGYLPKASNVLKSPRTPLRVLGLLFLCISV